MRIENDSMGPVEIDDNALYGAQTQRAIDNFTLSGKPMPTAFIRSLAQIKAAAAAANKHCKTLDEKRADAIIYCAEKIVAGQYLDHFPVPVLQTGSGTSTNMNMNEVLAHLASQHAGIEVHPNDHVNCSQSSNDVIPSCVQLSTAIALSERLMPALKLLISAIETRAEELAGVAKTGRTHLMDAMPLTLGQELGAWASQLSEAAQRIEGVMPRLLQLPLGGSAVGTGINVPQGYKPLAIEQLTQRSGLTCQQANNTFARMAGQDVALECSSTLRGLAVVFTKINNDLRWMSSGPLTGLGEIQLQALQPGSSIMPGKVNPVLPEATLMAAAQVIGNDSTIMLAAQSGNFQLNVMLPLIADKLLESIELMHGSCEATAATINGFSVNTEKLDAALAKNPILVTALNTEIGYDLAAKIAKRCYSEQRSVIDIALEETELSRDQLEQLLAPEHLTGHVTVK